MNSILPPTQARFDVAVIGGGSAGIAAAISSASSGARTCLIERLPFLGGMATGAEVGTICGLYYESKDSPEYIQNGFSRTFSEQLAKLSDSIPESYAEGLWYLPYRTCQFVLLAERLLNQARVELFLHSTVYALSKSNDKISSLTLLNWDQPYTIQPMAVIDCSGEALLSRLAGAELLPIDTFQAGALVFTLTGLPVTEISQLNQSMNLELIRGVKNGMLPEAAQKLSLVPGSYRQTTASFKLCLPAAMNRQVNFVTRLECQGRELVLQIVNFLRTQLPSCKNIELHHFAVHCGIRSGQRACGKYVLSKSDLFNRQPRADSISRAAWPIEYWGESRKPSMQYLGVNSHYDIPAGCLVSKSISNLYMAGRNISATEEALASARVIATCLATGYAAGVLAARSLQGKTIEQAVDQIQLQLNITST